jgi:hypothetical protein
MEILNKLKLFAYNVFMVFNPAILVIAFLVSFLSMEYSQNIIEFLHWFFFITLLLASPQLYHNYKINSNAKK